MIRTILVLVLGLYLALVGMVLFVGLDSIHHSHESERNNIALCSLRANQKIAVNERITKIEREEKLLADHPPLFPPSLILESIKSDRLLLHQQQRNLAGLSVLRCN